MKGDNLFVYILVLFGHLLIVFLSGKFSWDVCPVRGFLSFLLFMLLWSFFASLSEFVYQLLLVWLFDRLSE